MSMRNATRGRNSTKAPLEFADADETVAALERDRTSMALSRALCVVCGSSGAMMAIERSVRGANGSATEADAGDVDSPAPGATRF